MGWKSYFLWVSFLFNNFLILCLWSNVYSVNTSLICHNLFLHVFSLHSGCCVNRFLQNQHIYISAIHQIKLKLFLGFYFVLKPFNLEIPRDLILLWNLFRFIEIMEFANIIKIKIKLVKLKLYSIHSCDSNNKGANLKQLKSTFTDAVLFLLQLIEITGTIKISTAYSGGKKRILVFTFKTWFPPICFNQFKIFRHLCFSCFSHKHVISFLKIFIFVIAVTSISFLKIFIFVIAVTSGPLSRYPLTCVPNVFY